MSYIFLFGLAFVWLIFATIQDFRTREISNWLNFSLIAFALAFRAFYSNSQGDWNFFLLGIGGFALFFVLGYVLYYGKAFAGGDAKLLMALGPILPFESLFSYFSLGFSFIFLLFFCGAIYGISYVLFFLVLPNYRKFYPLWQGEIHTKTSKLFMVLGAFIFLAGLLFVKFEIAFTALFFVLGIVVSFSWSFARAVENGFMIKKIKANKLTEGDWLVKDVRVGEKIIKKNFQGLTWKEIMLLRKHGKEVWVKDGIPFAFSFLLAFIIMVFFFLTGTSPISILAFL